MPMGVEPNVSLDRSEETRQRERRDLSRLTKRRLMNRAWLTHTRHPVIVIRKGGPVEGSTTIRRSAVKNEDDFHGEREIARISSFLVRDRATM